MCPTVQNTTQGSLSVLLLNILNFLILGFPGGSEVKASACNVGDLGSIPGSGRSPGEGNSNPKPGESHGQKSLVGYSPQGHKESDTTERLHLTNGSFEVW